MHQCRQHTDSLGNNLAEEDEWTPSGTRARKELLWQGKSRAPLYVSGKVLQANQ